MSIEAPAAMMKAVAEHDDLAPDDDEYGDLDVTALEEVIIDLRTSVVRPASSDVAQLHLAQMVAAGREDRSGSDPPR